MLFLNWYPGVDDPFLSSSLKMTICSKRKTRRSLERDRTPASCSVTKKVSCCSSLPWQVSLPCGEIGRVNTINSVLTGQFFKLLTVINRCRVCWKATSLKLTHKYISLLFQHATVLCANLLLISRKGSERTSYPCSRPKFIMSLHSLGTWDIKSTAFCKSRREWFKYLVMNSFQVCVISAL